MSEKITIMSNEKAVFIGKYDPSQPRDKNGMWTGSGGGSGGGSVSTRGGGSGGTGSGGGGKSGGSSGGAGGGNGKGERNAGYPKGITNVPKDMKITETKTGDQKNVGKYTYQTIQYARNRYSAASYADGTIDIKAIKPYDNASYFFAQSKNGGKTFRIYDEKRNYSGTSTSIGETIREIDLINSEIKPMMSHY